MSTLILWPTDTYTGLELLSELRNAWTQREMSQATSSVIVVVMHILLSLTFCRVGILRSQQQQNKTKTFVKSICFGCFCVSVFCRTFPSTLPEAAVSGKLSPPFCRAAICRGKETKIKVKKAYKYKKQQTAPFLFFNLCVT